MSDQGLEAYLAKLQAERAMLDIRIAGVRAELGMEAVPEVGAGPDYLNAAATSAAPREPTVTGRVRSDEFYRMSIPEAVKRYLEIMKQPQPPSAIVAALKAGGVLSQSKNFYTTVWTAMRRQRVVGELVNTPTGWALSDWYPNKPKVAGEAKKAKKKGKKHTKTAQKPKKPAKVAKVASPAPRKGGWHSYLAERLAAGKTMKEAGAEWRKKKGDG
jgi:hypothetical protein